MRKVLTLAFAAALVLSVAALAGAAAGDSLVTVGSPAAPFSQNKQNEPALAVDASRPNILAAGANDNIDMEACNAGDDTTCPFTPGVGVSGVYFSFDSGKTWTQPTYTGLTARGCQGVPGNGDPDCTPTQGPIGTLPWYYENGLVADGDPAVAFGPKPGANGTFSFANGSRLYYANLSSNVGATRDESTFKGFEAIAVSRTDDVQRAAASDKSAWMPPVVISRQSSTTFSDKEQIWADNAASSPFFGTVYVCWASFRGQEKPERGPGAADGRRLPRRRRHLARAADHGRREQRPAEPDRRLHGPHRQQGHGVRLRRRHVSSQGHEAFELMSKSTDGGSGWSRPRPIAGPVTQPGIVDPVLGRPTIDGIAGARSDLAPAPSVDIANGAPTGTDATDRIVMTYVSGEITKPHVYFTESTNGGNTWSTPRAIEGATDRGYYTAPSISPNGTSVYVVYNAFTTPYQTTTATPRSLVGVVLQATAGATGTTGAFSQAHRSVPGDPRGSSQNNLVGEFLGDYVYAVATRTYGAAVWNDTRAAADCPAIDAWRMALQSGDTSVPRPAPQQECAASFGNSDISSFTTAP